ncbi:alpha/beta hydrolase [Rhodococcus oryzae]|uniref:Alpha/beta hydrolase n=1 Tax=Rhodococcus oryzae TaxID=2571143 RepID=A0ABY2RHX1_9NOCA|nr:alpha/beta hydrolase [Rhodococcus oryzae]TJZ75374.1 alpha/beta hydrolase [Rhodococcus oryzae]
MQEMTWPQAAVVLPGTGSDAHFAKRAFSGALTQVGVEIIAVEPDPQRVVESYLEAMDAAADRYGRILVGGVSIGAAVAAQWAARNESRAAGVLAALPAWIGDPAEAPAALSATMTARMLRADGLDAVTSAMIETSPAWLGGELERSWRSQWPHLPNALEEAAAYHGLVEEHLARITVPVGICAATDDPVHPIAVARRWVTVLRSASLATVTLDQIGTDAGILGRSCLTALTSS